MVDEKYQRGISEKFEDQLTDGILKPILERVRYDDTLTLEIRNRYINVYYRGGNLLKISAQAGGARFSTTFDMRYFDARPEHPVAAPNPAPPRIIADATHAQAWVDAFPSYKQAMDIRFSYHNKLEREYQQAVLRDNNRHKTGEVSHYTVIDIEYAQSPRAFPQQKADYRFDMIGLRWPAKGGTRARGIATPVIMEMKAGDGALASHLVGPKGDKLLPGFVKHVRDIERFLKPDPGEEFSGPYSLMCEELLRMFATKQRLVLPSIPKRMRKLEITELTPRPEVVFIIANHQPASSVLERELAAVVPGQRADYYVATVQHAGYALFAENMIPLADFVAGRRCAHRD